jgi:hypothetical protein
LYEEKVNRKKFKDYFDYNTVTQYEKTFNRSLTPAEKVNYENQGVKLHVIDAWWEEENKALTIAMAKKAIVDRERLMKEYKEHSHGHGHGHGHDTHKHKHEHKEEEIIVPVHTQGPSLKEYVSQMDLLKQAVEKIEAYYERVKYLDAKLRSAQNPSGKLVGENIDKLYAEFKQITGIDWNVNFNVQEFRQNREISLRQFLDELSNQGPGTISNQPARSSGLTLF